MGDGRGETEHSSQATVNLFGPVRSTILLFLGFGAVAALALAPLAGHGSFALNVAIAFVIAVFIAYLQFRALVYALSAALAPLPGVGLAVFAATEPLLDYTIALVYALGFAVALISGTRYASRLVEDEAPAAAVATTLRGEGPLMLSIALVAVLLPGCTAVMRWSGFGPAALLLAAAGLSAVVAPYLAVPLAASLMGDNEDFITRTNRIGETWERWLEKLSLAVQSPWHWSVAGIFVVLMAPAYFGIRGLKTTSTLPIGQIAAAALIALFIAAYLAARDWRRAVAVSLTCAGAALFGLWGYARAGMALDGALLLVSLQASTLTFALVAAVAAAPHADLDAIGASQASILRGGAAVATGLAAAIFVIPIWFWSSRGAAFGLLLSTAFAGAAALVFQPALAVTIEELWPRRATLAERYRVK